MLFRSLLLLDPTAQDVFETYIAKRDGEHEGYSWRHIVPAFAKRHGWRTESDLRFGTRCFINTMDGGLSGLSLDYAGLVTAAEALLPAKDFARLLMECVQWRAAKESADKVARFVDFGINQFTEALDALQRPYATETSLELRNSSL